jgi:hypothetical protein
MWSLLVWSQQQYISGGVSGGTASRFDSVVDALPRSILEHEKGLLKVFLLLFDLGDKKTADKDGSLHSGMVTVAASELPSNEEGEGVAPVGRVLILREPVSGLNDIFLNIFMRCVSSMQVQALSSFYVVFIYVDGLSISGCVEIPALQSEERRGVIFPVLQPVHERRVQSRPREALGAHSLSHICSVCGTR